MTDNTEAAVRAAALREALASRGILFDDTRWRLFEDGLRDADNALMRQRTDAELNYWSASRPE